MAINQSANPLDLIFRRAFIQKFTYEELRNELLPLNVPFIDNSTSLYYDPDFYSVNSVNRLMQQNQGIPRIIQKQSLYGIVLHKSNNFGKHVYIDVPGKHSGLIDQNIFFSNEINYNDYKQYLFEISSEDMNSNPVVGGIAEVIVPPEFPNHVDGNSQHLAAYKGMKSPMVVMKLNLSNAKIANSNSNYFAAKNSEEIS